LALAAHKESNSSSGGEIATIPLDVSNREAVKSLWSKVPPQLREVDILGTLSSSIHRTCHLIWLAVVNNAGFVLGVDRVGSIQESEIDSMFATNVMGLIDMTQLFVKGEHYACHQLHPSIELSGDRFQRQKHRAYY
jgi:3-hydroxy acid dehydrogenase/malonic semialdehyde reductase